MKASSTSRRARKALLWTLLVLGFFELAARQVFSGSLRILKPSTDPVLGYELVPGTFVSDGFLRRIKQPVEYEISPGGCRASSALQGPVVSPDVVLLGGSVAFGLDAAFEDTVGWRLREALRKKTGRPLEIESCAVPGHRLVQSLRMVETQALTKHPRVVAVLLVKQHLKTSINWTRLIPKSPAADFLTTHVRVARIAYLFGYLYLIEGESFDGASSEETQANLERSIEQLSESFKGSATRGVFFLGQDVKHSSMNLEQALSSRGFEVHRFQSLPDINAAPELWADSGHWNGRGAEALSSQLVDGLDAALAREGGPR